MTVSTVVDHNDYIGNGVTTSFPYTFRIFKKTDLEVSVVDLDENITVLVLDTDYTVTNAGGYNGGNVVLATPLANGWQIAIARELEPTQETDLRNQGKFFAEVHEDAFDKLTMLIQQAYSVFRLALRKPSSVANWYDALNNYIRNLRDPRDPQDAATKNYADNLSAGNTSYTDSLFSRTLRTPESITQLPSADLRKNKIVGFDSSGNPTVLLPESGSAADVLLELASSEDGKGDALISVKQPVPGALPRTQHLFNVDYVNVKDFGALGDGLATPLSSRYATLAAAQIDYPFVTDLSTPIDTAAIQAAWNAVTMKGVKDFPQHAVGESIYNWMSTKGPRLYIPSGSYKWSYPGLNLNDTVNQVPIFAIIAESKTSVEIDIGDNDNYFIDTAVNPYHFQIIGIKTYGGKGMIRCSSTAQNQTRVSVVQDCTVSAYRECGIGFSSQDWPNIKIRNCQLYNRTGYQTIGIVMPGWSANSEIVGCEFGLAEGTGVYSYAMKLSSVAADAGGFRGPSTPILIADNSVYRRNSVGGSASLWIVPNPSSNDNAGRAVVLRNNKWGAENVNTSSYHILVADESTSGTWTGNKRHLATKSTGFVRGLVLDKNNIRFEADATQPYIASFTPHIQGMVCEDIIDNTIPVNILEFRGGLAYSDFSVQDYDNIISTRYWLAPTATNYVGKPVSSLTNFPATVKTIDEQKYLNTTSIPVSNGQSDVAFRSLMSVSTSFAGLVTLATKSAIDNSIGIPSEAASVVFSSNSGRISYTLQNWQENRIAWIEVELAAGDTNPINSVAVEVVESDNTRFARRVINLTSEWRLYRIPIVIPIGATTAILRVLGNGYSASTTTVKVGRVFAYHASEPISTGNLRCIGSSWNTQHLVMAGYHLWVDGSGVLRIKNGQPTSGTDGTVVGSQA